MSKEMLVRNSIEIQPEQKPVVCVVPDESMLEAALWVSAQTGIAGTMLPKAPEELIKLFSEERSILIMGLDGVPVAHASIAFLYEDEKILEIGGLIVAPEMRHMGYAKMATRVILDHARKKYPDWKIIALCNQYSLPLMMKFGAIVVDIENSSLLPDAVWEACASCPNLQKAKSIGKLCCDTPVIIP